MIFEKFDTSLLPSQSSLKKISMLFRYVKFVKFMTLQKRFTLNRNMLFAKVSCQK